MWAPTSMIVEHFKGGKYTVLFSAQNSTNGTDREKMVVYVSHTTGQIYCRKKEEFWEKIQDSLSSTPKLIARFKIIEQTLETV